MIYISWNELWYGASDSCKMALPDSLEVQAFFYHDPSWEGPPQTIRKNVCLNWFVGTFGCLKKKITEDWSKADPNPPP